MSTSNKLTYLNETKQELKQKINNLGGSIDEQTTFRQYAEQLQNVYDNLPKTDYEEGSNITLSNTLKGKLDYENNIVGYGDTEQDGEPTPSTPVSIQCVTGNQEIVESDGNNNSITYPISLGNIELCKIGDYADELLYDVENDKVYKYEKIGKVVLNGSEGSWSVNHRSNGYQFDRPISTMKNGVNNVIEVMSNYFKGIAFNSRDSINESIYSGNNDKNIRILTNIATTINDFTTWLSTHNLKFYYVLETPTLTEITDQTLINQVKALYNAHSNNGTTIITSNGDLPMIIKVRALKGE